MAPSRKRTSDASEAAADSENATPPPQSKKAKKEPLLTTAAARKKADDKAPISTSMQQDEHDDPFWELSSGGTRRVTVNSFKGAVMVNIREYYEADGKKMPGKKGISMPMDQWAALMEVLPQIEGVLRGKGESVVRPKFGEGNGVEVGSGKKNFEATSEEDEGH